MQVLPGFAAYLLKTAGFGGRWSVASRLLCQSPMNSRQLVVKCCLCKAVKTGAGWVREEHEDANAVLYSHGYCPSCLEGMLLELDSLEQPSKENRAAG